ncbi:O-unit flippase-like protein [Marinilactibacillus psychrotolerans]|uniref:Polysaccharide biosynthesis protein n=1 Tax=Marinilactibacillus psychrotolerans TaxID=191770 RepID=A0AAV3WU21_9LACT|nr:O-unit flippase-like protein [Marinilactibacillus psychrotolerans]GEL67592.1 hypothetical protein MPS01_17470 [Marinilactibacillus psychrotolerans]GEQ35522.1 hypothetical protein M132T_10300 [Marinilactibacillus psychrotolerans]SDD08225.1 Na+-driven multidrug efflux pump [Marinilactibacillus psychrotolerans]
MMNIKIGKKEVIWSYMGYILNNGTNLILMPFVLNFLPTQELGLWYTFLSVGGMVNLLDFGFLPTITRNFTYSWSGVKKLTKSGLGNEKTDATPNYELLYLIIKASRMIYLIIALTALAGMTTLGTLYVINILEDNFSLKYIVAWIIYSVAVFLNMYYGYWRAALKGVGLVKGSQKSILYARLVQIVVSLVCLFLGLTIIGVALAYLVSGVVTRQLSIKYFYNSERIKGKLNYKVAYKDIVENIKEVFLVIWHSAWRTGIFSLGTFLTLQSSVLFTSNYLGLKVTASYGLAFQMFNMLYALASIFFSTYMIKMSEARVNNNNKMIKEFFSLSIVVSWIAYVIGVIGIVFFSEPILRIIGSNTSMLPRPILMYMGIDLFLDFNYNKFVSYILTGNSIPFYKSSFLSGVGVVILTFALLNFTNLGIWSILISRTMIQGIYNYWYWPKFVLKELDMKISEIIKIGFNEVSKLIK